MRKWKAKIASMGSESKINVVLPAFISVYHQNTFAIDFVGIKKSLKKVLLFIDLSKKVGLRQVLNVNSD